MKYKYLYVKYLKLCLYRKGQIIILLKHTYSVMDRQCPNLQIINKIGMKNSVKNTQKWIAY